MPAQQQGGYPIVPLRDVLPPQISQADYDRLAGTGGTAGTRNTFIGAYIGRDPSPFPLFEAKGDDHAEDFMREALPELIRQAKASGQPLTLVTNHTPCTRETCTSTFIEASRLARDADVHLRVVFTGSYAPTMRPAERTTLGRWLAEMMILGTEVLVGNTGQNLSPPDAIDEGRPLRGASMIVDAINQADVAVLWYASRPGPGRYPVPPASVGAALEVIAGVAPSGPSTRAGGIDFTTLELRYISDQGDGIAYSMAATEGAVPADPTARLAAARLQSDAFFVWLSLHPSTFWVNLNPTEPDRIVDEDLGRTTVGRVLLEADLELKRTVGRIIHPDNASGQRFWDALFTTNGSCFSFRQWVVPKPAVVRADRDGLHILDAPLSVQMESEYLSGQGIDPANSCPSADSVTAAEVEQAYRTIVLPEVERAVNTAPEYADLRRVYLSRVAAEWYRQQSQQLTTTYGDLIDSGDISPWTDDGTWTPRQTFDSYVDSYNNHEFDITHETTEGEYIVTRQYVYGGVDFSAVPFTQQPPEDFARRWADRADVVEDSFDEPVTDESGLHWLGARAVPAAADERVGVEEVEDEGEGHGERALPTDTRPPHGADDNGESWVITLTLLVIVVTTIFVARSRRLR
jgi:hypothetical protein